MSLSVAFVYKHTTTGEVVVVDIERAREIDSSAAMRRGEWKHTSTIEPITVLQLIVKSNGQKRAKIIRDLGKKP